MENLFGTYECKIDAKGRLLLPALLKKQLAPFLADGFILKRSIFEECLELYTMAEWRTVTDELRQKSRFKRKNMTFFRRFTAGVKPIELDGSGRMLVAKDLVTFAGIKKELVLTVTVGNIIEIWDKERYEEVINDPDIDFGDLAEEVMGDLD